MPSWRARRSLIAVAVLVCGCSLVACGEAVGPTAIPTKVERVKFRSDTTYLVIEVLDDALVHFEMSAMGAGPDAAVPLYTTPMVSKTDYRGPSRFTNNGAGMLMTAALRLDVDLKNLCFAVTDTARKPAAALTTICPSRLGTTEQSLTLAASGTHHVYGLGEHFLTPGVANGDLEGQRIAPGNAAGNALTSFNGGNTGNAQFPVMYALGAAGENYALFLDHLYAQEWSFADSPWTVRTGGRPDPRIYPGRCRPPLFAKRLQGADWPPAGPTAEAAQQSREPALSLASLSLCSGAPGAPVRRARVPATRPVRADRRAQCHGDIH